MVGIVKQKSPASKRHKFVSKVNNGTEINEGMINRGPLRKGVLDLQPGEFIWQAAATAIVIICPIPGFHQREFLTPDPLGSLILANQRDKGDGSFLLPAPRIQSLTE